MSNEPMMSNANHHSRVVATTYSYIAASNNYDTHCVTGAKMQERLAHLAAHAKADSDKESYEEEQLNTRPSNTMAMKSSSSTTASMRALPSTTASKRALPSTYDLQENLLKKRLAVTGNEKSPEWTRKEVINVMKSLKKNKSRDPLRLVNEIFMIENAGEDLVRSLTLMMNRVKITQIIPALFRMRDVIPIYKNKGSRLDLDNDRGVFTGTVLNSIFQKFIYNHIYDTVDQNLTDNNVGARNHSFIVNSVIHFENANKAKSQGINLLIGDFSKCFDAMICIMLELLVITLIFSITVMSRVTSPSRHPLERQTESL